jgi:primosomal protein N' (replication factor Y)
VRVPFGERALTGVVVSAGGEETSGLRDLLEVLDEEPVCPPELLATAEKAARRFFASTGEVLKSALSLAPARGGGGALPHHGERRARAGGRSRGRDPRSPAFRRRGALERASDPGTPGSAARSRGARPPAGHLRARQRKPRTEKAYSPGGVERRAEALGKSRRGREVLDYLESVGPPATAAEIRLHTGAGPGPSPKPRGARRPAGLRAGQEVGRSSQAPAARRLPPDRGAGSRALRDPGRDHPRVPFIALLQGVTGSGKTEVYLRSISAALEAGRGSVWLVPEIALTPVFCPGAAPEVRRPGRRPPLCSVRARARRGMGPRAAGAARIVIGPRSAVFAPVADPGLFLVDEEQDGSYKQRDSPRYDAREVAALRAKANGAALVFGSATSVDGGMARGARRAHEASAPDLPHRLPPASRSHAGGPQEGAALPEEKGIPLFSRPLVERLRAVFARKEQAIVLQPRRGFAPFLLCRECGHDFRCTRCSVCRTVHDRGRNLICHYCGERVSRPLRCPSAAARSSRRSARDRARGGPFRGAVPGSVLCHSRPRFRPAPRTGRRDRGSPLGARVLPDRDADGRQGP